MTITSTSTAALSTSRSIPNHALGGWLLEFDGALPELADFPGLVNRRQCKYGLPWTPLWVVLVLLFGLPVYFGYLAHRRWPTCLPCPHCRRHVPRDRSACFACHRDFPAPAPKGIEVFA